MQLYTRIGFFSVVRKRASATLTVETDQRSNLDELRQKFMAGLSPTITKENASYPHRATIQPDQFGAGLEKMGKAIDYPDCSWVCGYEPRRAFDYKQFSVLLVDDESAHLRIFRKVWQDQFRILTASSADAGLSLLKQHRDDIGVLMVDSRMPGHKGVWLLEKARRIKPHMIRMYFSAYQTKDSLREACSIGIHKFILIPYDPPEMEETLRVALRQFSLLNDVCR
jgi:CheY-like chemotaxis protein